MRPLRQSDAVWLHEAFADPETMRYWSTGPHQDQRVTDAWVTRALRSGAPELSVERDGVPIGRVGLWAGNEIGFLFLRSYRGSGFAANSR